MDDYYPVVIEKGDKQSAGKIRKEGIDYYVHTYCEDIREVYLREIFKLQV